MIAKTDNRILWLPGEERMWDDDASSRSPAGVRVTPDNALAVSTVFACIRVLAETVAGLPLYVLERLRDGGRQHAKDLPLYKKLSQQPNGWQTSFEWRCQLMLHLGLYNVAYCEIIPGASGAIDQLVPLHPSRMKVERLPNGRLRYKYREQSGMETVYTQDQVLAIRGLSEDGINGLSPVETCRDAIALARAYEIHGARFFGAGARPGFVLSTEGQLNAEAREQLRAQWDRRHGGVGNSHTTAVLTGGLKPFEIPQSSNTDSQWLESRRFAVEEICRIYRVPQHKVQSMQGQSYGSLEQVSQDFLTDTILPWLRRFESAFMRDLITEDDRYEIQFDTKGMLRADAAARSSLYGSLFQIGVLSPNEIRDAEGLNPVEGGDVHYRPLNLGVLGEPVNGQQVLDQQQPGSGIDGQAVEGGLSGAAAPVPQETSLDTAEVSSLLTVVKQITDGLLSVDAARAIITAAFPVLSSARVETILAGVKENKPALPPAPQEPAASVPVAPAARSLPELRALTISMDFDRTFAADPQLWGEFARKSVAEGNTVVMISRRPEADRQTVMDTLGDYADAFSQVLLIGGDTLKADAAKAAGIDVDVWVDDSPQTITDEPAPGAKRGWCPTGKGGGQDNSCATSKGGVGGGGDSGPAGDGSTGSSGIDGEIAAARERHAADREAWKQEKKQAMKEVKKQEKKDVSKLDRQYERELDKRIELAGKEHDKETSAKVKEVTKSFKKSLNAVAEEAASASDADRPAAMKKLLGMMDQQNEAVNAARVAQDQAWKEKSKAVRKQLDEEFSPRYDQVRENYDAQYEGVHDTFNTKREEIQAKHDAEREQLLKKRRGKV